MCMCPSSKLSSHSFARDWWVSFHFVKRFSLLLRLLMLITPLQVMDLDRKVRHGRNCLAQEVEVPPAAPALDHLFGQFFTTKPYPCDPSTLPKYPPSKEFDTKLRDKEARA
ncbi:hypothetical protein IFM89_006503 [Coptis chinensis]|uniref:Uncharacterized protein n=1 Tax=Coptis chinensis TaxID=261450 RepID=A0A835MD27_9MAGN|nr:hypothetical protein IFM89_006503 [Coptis chinensis]